MKTSVQLKMISVVVIFLMIVTVLTSTTALSLNIKKQNIPYTEGNVSTTHDINIQKHLWSTSFGTSSIVSVVNPALKDNFVIKFIGDNIHDFNDIKNTLEMQYNANDKSVVIFNKTTYMVPMRDGVRLATDVYFPAYDGIPRPVILYRTPYGKNNSSALGEAWAGWNFIGVIQDIRGMYDSEGEYMGNLNGATDGYDTVQWITAQSWSNEKIATFGGSATGIAQYLMAGENPAGLVCQFIEVATPNVYKHATFSGGEFLKALVEGWTYENDPNANFSLLFGYENYSLGFPWTNISLDDDWPDVNVPAVHFGGWYDCFQQGTLDGFQGYQYLGGPGARGKSKLIMGPWVHGSDNWDDCTQGQLTFPDNSVDTFSSPMFLEMLDQYILGGSNDFENRPTVSYYVMGDVDTIDAPCNYWRFADDWPISATERSWFFHDNGLLSTLDPENYGPLTYTYDPSDPVPTVGGQNLYIPAGPYDQSYIGNRDDVLVFTSPVLEQSYEATGPIKARLFVSSDCPDTDFTVKLTDVYPDGRSMIITDGILRMRNRNGTDHWEFMEPGEIYEIEVDMWSTSYIWNTGHQIRVDVSSSNYPRFLNNPNTVDGICQNTTYVVAHNTLYLDTEHPSRIVLPEIVSPPTSTPPVQPEQPNGLLKGKIGNTYTYSSSAVDLDSDPVYLLFDWGDGTSSGWLGPYESGELVQAKHKWNAWGIYSVRVKAMDMDNMISDWSDHTLVFMKNANITIVFSPHNEFFETPPINVIRGDSFTFSATVSNNLHVNQRTDFWVMLETPQHELIGPLYQYNDIELDGSLIFTANDLRQNVPEWASLGIYKYVGYCGDYPNTMIDYTMFEFNVIPTIPILPS